MFPSFSLLHLFNSHEPRPRHRYSVFSAIETVSRRALPVGINNRRKANKARARERKVSFLLAVVTQLPLREFSLVIFRLFSLSPETSI